MIRKIDKYNRIGIPKEIQKLMGIKSGQTVEIKYDDNKIIIYPTTNETIRSFIITELKYYQSKLNNATDEKSQILFHGLIIELERLLNKYDELY